MSDEIDYETECLEIAGRHVHVIPVDPSLSAEEAFKELCIFGRRVTFTGIESWAVIERCDGDECATIEDEPCPS